MRQKLLLLLLGVLSALPVLAYDFEYTYEGVTLRYKYLVINGEAKYCQISGYKSFSGELIIPNVANDGTRDYSVTSIDEYAFKNCRGMISVEIPSSITSIYEGAFDGCSGLVRVELTSIESLCNIYFSNESANPLWYANYLYIEGEEEPVRDVVIPETVTKIRNYAFVGWKSLDSIVIGDYVTSIGSGAFYGCSNLTSVVIGNSVTKIDYRAFQDCRSLTSVEIPNSVTSIGFISFSGCSGLTSVVIGNSVTSIDSGAFSDCRSLTHVSALSVSPPSMEDNSFRGLYDTVNLSVPDEAVGNYLATNWSLFRNIRNASGQELRYFSDGVLDYRINPADMTASVIGAKNCSNLQIPERFTDDSDPENPVRYYIKGIQSKAFEGKSVFSVELNSRSQMEYIGDYAFKDTKFPTITLPETVSYIGESAFRDSKIESIKIPENVTEIKNYTFYNCTSLTDIRLNNTIESIGADAFSMDKDSYNSDMRYGSLTIPATLKSIGSSAFLYRELDRVTIFDLRAWCDILFMSIDSNPCGWANDGFWLGEDEIVDLVIPDGVTEIKGNSFITKNKLKSVKIPSSVTSIGWYAFMMNVFKDIVIPASVESIGYGAFGSCSYPDGTATSFTKYLTSFTLEEGQTPILIKPDAFEISRIYSPDGRTRYNTPEIFYMGRPLESLPDGFKGTLVNLTVGNTVESIPDGLFAKCDSIAELKLGSSIGIIGDEAFSGCSKLAEVILPPSVETIGDSAFAGDSSLESIHMGHKVKTIGEKAFDGCQASIVSITAQTPPTAPNNTFSVYSGKLYLQGQAAIDAYYDAYTCWDRFSSYVMIEPTGIKLDGDRKISGKPGETFQLKATLLPENVTLPQIFWRSTNPEVATVDANGLVTLHMDLEEVLTRAAEDEGDTCKIIAESLYADGPLLEVSVFVDSTAVDEIYMESFGNAIDYTKPYEVYNLNGVKVGDSKEGLAKGIYIVKQCNAAVKISVKD